MEFLRQRIGIDLGTANTLVFVPGKGVVTSEPSVVAVSTAQNEVLAVGDEAKAMIGRTPEDITVFRPLKDGVIADFRITEAMLKYFITKVCGRLRFGRPDVMISIPAGITSTERRAVIDAAVKAGAKEVYIVKEPVLAAVGAGIPIHDAHGNMIIDIGGGTSEVAVISLGSIVVCHSARVGGDKFDSAIADYIKRKYSLAIGDRTAEEMKKAIGSALIQQTKEVYEVHGRDLMGGMPRTVSVHANEVTEALQDELREIIHAIKKVLRETPPELASDIMDKGMILSGGGALLRNLDQLIIQTIGVPCYPADDPLRCVVRGTGEILDNLDQYKRTVFSKK